jgi:hypothetical protein
MCASTPRPYRGRISNPNKYARMPDGDDILNAKLRGIYGWG